MKGKLLRIFNEKTRLLELVSQQGGFILALIEINLKSYKYITLPDLLPYLRLRGGKPAKSSMPQQRSRSHIARKISKTEQTSKAKGGHHRRTPPCYPA